MSAVMKSLMPAWTTGWTAQTPLQIDYNFVPADSPWVPGPAAGMQQRDLGVTTASKGKMSARHIRVTDPKKVPTEWCALDTDFHFIFVLKGSASLENSAGQSVTLERGLAAWQPAFLRHRIFDYSADFEMFEMLAPADPKAYLGKDTPLPVRAKEFAGMQGQYLAETPSSFVQGAGPRKYFRYRDLQTTKPTDGRIHIHLVHAIEPMPGGTGWHTHSMRQLFYVVGGAHVVPDVEGGDGRLVILVHEQRQPILQRELRVRDVGDRTRRAGLGGQRSGQREGAGEHRTDEEAAHRVGLRGEKSR